MLWFCVLMWTLKKRRNCQFTVWAINPVFQQEKYLHFLMLSFTMLQNKMHLLLYASTMSKMTTKIIEFVYTATYIYRNNPMLFRLYVKSKCRQTFSYWSKCQLMFNNSLPFNLFYHSSFVSNFKTCFIQNIRVKHSLRLFLFISHLVKIDFFLLSLQ